MCVFNLSEGRTDAAIMVFAQLSEGSIKEKWAYDKINEAGKPELVYSTHDVP